jgi:hypothetical protein
MANSRTILNTIKSDTGDDYMVFTSGAETIYSSSFELHNSELFGFQYQYESAGTVNVAMYLEQSNDNINFVLPDGKTDPIATAATTTLHIIALSPVVTTHARIKMVAAEDNAAGTAVLKLAQVHDI